MKQRYCKSCQVPEVQIDIDFYIEHDRVVSDELYEKRVAICMECSALLNNKTCRFSGELVTYRAMIKEKGCPFPTTRKW
ncbi:DUF6171 family protein [Alkalihalobacillus sp. 1P02AB]|uniref:DUF6171 family protein n=1 Tax=Alkalihalobacillus sp. 1P02AB TaxID=3132260 RepID=UPI0039A72182